MGNDWVLALKNLFLPMFCKRCDARLLTEENGYFCPTCWESSPRVCRPFCIRCGRPHKAAVGFMTRSNFPCEDCRDLNGKGAFRRIYGAAHYAEAVEVAIKMLKFHDKPRLAGLLAGLMAEFAACEMDVEQYDFLVPVPLHRVRERDRGYNQSRLLVRELLTAFPRARMDESLRRLRPTRVQSLATSADERKRNIAGAFGVTPGSPLGGSTVLLVDDVVTTSSTVSECAQALRVAGVAAVDVLAAALAVPGYTPEPEPARQSPSTYLTRLSARWNAPNREG